MLNLSLTPGSLPGGTSYCFSDWQRLLIDIAANTTVALDLSTASLVLVQDTVPGATQHGNLWFDTRVDRMYRWNTTYGAWLAAHPIGANSSERRLWTGDLTSLLTHDGGDAGAPGVASGAMWTADSDFTGRSPIGPGLIPGSVPPLTPAVGDNLGEGSHTMLLAELAAHTHDVALDGGGNDGSAKVWTAVTDNNVVLTYTTTSAGSSTPFGVVHPVRAAYVIKRSDRVFYKAS